MTDSFLGRWSRRKAASQSPAPSPEPPEPPPDLPDIATLDATSDFAAFLQKGVGAELQRRALRVAWETDSKIASFRGMADYDWDFNAPSYGRLWAADDVGKLLRAVLATPEPSPARDEPALQAADKPARPTPPEALPPPAPEPVLAMGAEPEAAPVPRRHGSALPC